MTGDKNKFTSLTLKDKGNVKFSDNSKGKIIGIGNIGKIGKVSSFLIGNSLKAKGYFAIFKYAISTIDKSSFV